MKSRAPSRGSGQEVVAFAGAGLMLEMGSSLFSSGFGAPKRGQRLSPWFPYEHLSYMETKTNSCSFALVEILNTDKPQRGHRANPPAEAKSCAKSEACILSLFETSGANLLCLLSALRQAGAKNALILPKMNLLSPSWTYRQLCLVLGEFGAGYDGCIQVVFLGVFYEDVADVFPAVEFDPVDDDAVAGLGVLISSD